MAAKKIDYDTILACKQGDSEALNRVVVHYDKMITDAASKTIINDQGRRTTARRHSHTMVSTRSYP